MKHLETRKLIKHVASSNDVTVKQVEEVIDSIKQMLYNTMSYGPDKINAYYPVVKVKNFGRFYVPEGIAKHVKIKLENKLTNGDVSNSELEVGSEARSTDSSGI